MGIIGVLIAWIVLRWVWSVVMAPDPISEEPVNTYSFELHSNQDQAVCRYCQAPAVWDGYMNAELGPALCQACKDELDDYMAAA